MTNRVTNRIIYTDTKEMHNYVFYTDGYDMETPNYIYKIAKALDLECDKPILMNNMVNRKEFVGFAKQYAILVSGESSRVIRFIVEANRCITQE